MKAQVAVRACGFDQYAAPIPANFSYWRPKNQPASGSREFLSQEIRNRCVASLDAKQAIRSNRIFRGLLLRQRCDGNVMLIGSVESLDVIAGGLSRERIDVPAIQILGKAHVRVAGLFLHPLPEILQYAFCRPALLIRGHQAAAIEPER